MSDKILEIKKYVKEISGVNYNTGYGANDIFIALIVQNNLLLSKLIDLMCIATGMSEDEATDAVQISSEVIKEKGKYKIMCGVCGNGVIPDAMNYCPRCKADLTKQIAQQVINKGGS